MTQAQIASINRHCMELIPTIDRAAMLVARIKIEARWLLISAPDSCVADSPGLDRREFVTRWPTIRNCQPGDSLARHFYEIAVDRGTALARLIAARREREHMRRNQK